MGTVGVQEMVVIFLVALVLFGPKKLPELGRTIGKAITEFRRASNDLKASFEREMHDLERETEALKEASPTPRIMRSGSQSRTLSVRRLQRDTSQTTNETRDHRIHGKRFRSSGRRITGDRRNRRHYEHAGRACAGCRGHRSSHAEVRTAVVEPQLADLALNDGRAEGRRTCLTDQHEEYSDPHIRKTRRFVRSHPALREAHCSRRRFWWRPYAAASAASCRRT